MMGNLQDGGTQVSACLYQLIFRFPLYIPGKKK
jgi:hypothetical protein